MLMSVPPAVTEGVREEQDLRDMVPNSFYVQQQDLKKFGYTYRCPGCRSIIRGGTRQGHNDACRHRIMKELGGDERVKWHRAREDEYIEKAFERQDSKRRKEGATSEDS